MIRHDRPVHVRHGECTFFVHSSLSFGNINVLHLECGAVKIYFHDFPVSFVGIYDSKPSSGAKDFETVLK